MLPCAAGNPEGLRPLRDQYSMLCSGSVDVIRMITHFDQATDTQSSRQYVCIGIGWLEPEERRMGLYGRFLSCSVQALYAGQCQTGVISSAAVSLAVCESDWKRAFEISI